MPADKRKRIPDGILGAKTEPKTTGLQALRMATGSTPSSATVRRKSKSTVGTMYYVTPEHRRLLQAEAFRRAQEGKTRVNISDVLRSLLDDVLADWLASARARKHGRTGARE
jgi:hypothetical protein